MRLFALTLLLAFAGSASADPGKFAGDWVGKGSYILRGDLYQCAQVKFGFSSTGDHFVFEYGERQCDKHSESFARVEMTFQDGGLFYYGTKVGEYKDNKVEVAFDMPEGDGNIRHWRMSMRAEGKNLVYEERRIMNEEETPMISFAGLMIKQ